MKRRRTSLSSKKLAKSTLQQLKREHSRDWATALKPIKDAVKQSEQLTDRDFKIMINAR
jgi:hypothetical protein